MADDPAVRVRQLESALGEARQRVASLQASIQEAESGAHDALTAADFNTANRLRSDVATLRPQLETATAAEQALARALEQVSAEVHRAGWQSRYDQLSNAMAATRDEMRQLTADANEALLGALAAIRRGLAVQEEYAALYRERYGLAETLGIPAGNRHVDVQPITDWIGERPIRADLQRAVLGMGQV